MRTLVILATLAIALTALPAQATPYGPVVGVNAVVGVASGQNQPSFVAPSPFSKVTVVVTDDVGEHTYFSVCVERSGDSLCSRSDVDADFQASGYDTVTLNVGSLPTGTKVTAFVYTVSAGLDSAGNPIVGIGTTGVATATFS